MDFRLLGPLEVFADRAPLQIAAGKQRALLAILLLQREPHRVPRADRRRSLGRGRAGLGPEDGADPRLAAAEGASRAAAAHASPRLPARGRRRRARPGPLRALGRRRPAGALAGRCRGRRESCWASALALWRGPALAEFSEPFARHEGARLEELRLAALEWRIEADLALGHHRDVVGELETLIAEHPLRERLRSQHMLALYRSGRHAEALASYQAFRRTLADELGIEPSASLRELERLMLRQDPTLELPTAAHARRAATDGRPASPAPTPGRRRLRAQRRRPDRLPGRRRRAARPRSRPRLGLHLPARLGEPEAGRLLPAARVDGAAHPLRQARHRPLRPGLARAPARPGDAHGRRACGAWTRSAPSGRSLLGISEGGRDVDALRRDAPAADAGARPDGHLPAADAGARLPARGERRGSPTGASPLLEEDDWASAVTKDWLARVGPDILRDPAAVRWYTSYVAARREPRREQGDPAHERRDRHPRRPADDQRADARALPRGRVLPRRRLDSWASASRARAWSSCRATTTCRGRATASRCSTRSSDSSPGSATTSSPTASSPPCSSPTSSSRRKRGRRPRLERAARAAPPARARAARALSRPRGRHRRRRRCSRPSTAPPAPSAAPRRSSLPSASSASRCAPASTPARSSGRTRSVRGIAVHIGARIAAAARPGEVLVSSTVKDIVAGSGIALRGARRARAGRRPGHLAPVRRHAVSTPGPRLTS